MLRINTELVQTDVMVFDKKGSFVSGLKPEQFELTVEGKPQPITFLSRLEPEVPEKCGCYQKKRLRLTVGR